MSTQSRPAYVHKHFHYHYHYDQGCSQPLNNMYAKQNSVSQQSKFPLKYEDIELNDKKSWRDYINPEVNKIYDELCMKQSNAKFQEFRYRNQSQSRKQIRDLKIDRIKRNHLNNLSLHNKTNSRTSFESLKQQIKQHQQFIKNYSNNDKMSYEYQSKSMINLNDKQLTKNQIQYQQTNQSNFSRITPINSIDQLSYKRTDSRIVYGSKPIEHSITPIKRESIKTQNDFEMPQNKTLMSLMTRGSQSQLKLSTNQKRGLIYKPQQYLAHSLQKIQNGVYNLQEQFSLCQNNKNNNQNTKNISYSMNYQNKNMNFQYNRKDELQQQMNDNESYRNKLIRQQCQYLRDRILTHYQEHHDTKIN